MVADKGYKMTDVGLIPEDWEVKNLVDVVEYIHGKAHEKYIEDDGKFIVVNSKFISSDGKVIKFSNKNFLPSKKGDVLTVLSDLPNGKALAKCYYVDSDNKYAINQRICIWRSMSETSNKFIYHLLNRYKYFLSLNDGVSQTHILNHHIKACKVQIPSLPEQVAIAEALSDMDALISQTEKLIEKKKAIKQGMMQELLTGKKRLSGFGVNKGYKMTEVGLIPEDWEVMSIGDVMKIRHGKDQKNVQSDTGLYPIYGTGGQMGWSINFLYDKPSVLIGRKGTIDRPRYIDVPFWTVDTLFYSEIFSIANPYYLYCLYQQIDWYRFNEASGVPSLNARTIESIKIGIPTKEEQTAIAEALSDMDKEISIAEEKLSKLKQQKQGMMQSLLTGKIRLV
jgi:type I restriction enzyme S subunit